MPKIGIVVPCYNEANRLNLKEYLRFIQNNHQICLVFVNDGSSDGTEKLLGYMSAEKPDQISAISHHDNQGKAAAVYSGVKFILSHKNVDLIGYWDADLSTPLDDILTFADIFRKNDHYKLICGSRIRRMGSKIERKSSRHYLGRVFATFVSLTLGLPIYDSQCGAKLMTKELAGRLFDQPFASRWIFDVEMIARVLMVLGRRQTEKSIFEAPLQKWEDVEGSNLRFYDMILSLHDLYKISKKLKKRKSLL